MLNFKELFDAKFWKFKYDIPSWKWIKINDSRTFIRQFWTSKKVDRETTVFIAVSYLSFLPIGMKSTFWRQLFPFQWLTFILRVMNASMYHYHSLDYSNGPFIYYNYTFWSISMLCIHIDIPKNCIILYECIHNTDNFS